MVAPAVATVPTMHAATMHGLHEWTEAMFEKLGWMVLAKSRGGDHYNKKVDVYKESVDDLIAHLQQKLSLVKEQDRKDDVQLLLDNTMVLKSFLPKLDAVTGGKKNNDNKNKNTKDKVYGGFDDNNVNLVNPQMGGKKK